MKSAFLDTNVVLRYLLADDDKLYRRALKAFAAAEKQEIALILTPEIMAEVIHVLRSYYTLPQDDIALAMERILFHQGVGLSDERVMAEALQLYQQCKLDIADCLLAARASVSGESVVSFDKDFKKLAAVDLHQL